MNDRTYRKAVPEDASRCIEIRGRTRENAFSAAELRALGITADTWRDGIANGAFPGYVCCVDGTVIGYCFGDRDSGEIVVLALLPAHEGEGIGKALLRRVVDDFRARGFTNLFLGCSDDPAVRSHGFYRHLGWTPTGERDAAGDEILALRLG
ncbi:GNAT family N-acetyltransferase [Burkholderia stagnalis]|uniref:GNAT family N-acetyltransferase n=1 Tax=Burkholderia stagnalis TaxID=1503054 RepID=UPI000F56C96B|nr:GNAT family N-acetyltransferase [Burkholderia stagnalis]RQQ05211.1 GNAT family N-acetyltransferase [Burkholderia stagnalis]RQQ19614.1 GNAT family N-acetyltransferase [Burkholderia stagnalis]RQQ27460.1 GNAT family N-acetyltransferase [Burkholderia stagnalis]RQQ31502.1 GNAT family N-acetyltransferase [Burkholderia stagnalis]RQQ31858.1 GNAT family N-acetyltransferase [Burkholderia stagnalis]